MKKSVILAAAILLTSTFAMASNPSEERVGRVLNRNAVLKNTLDGVKAAYHMLSCTAFVVKSYARTEGEVSAEALCKYKDAYGDETGIVVTTEGVFYDGDLYNIRKVEFVFAG